MSHFTVGVIIKESEILEKEKELISRSREDIITSLVEEAMEPFCETYEVEPYLEMTNEELQEELDSVINYEGDQEWHLKMKEKYKDASLEKFCEEYLGYTYEEDGAYSTVNPDGKWDWYVIGGRWNNTLPIKNKTIVENADYNGYEDNLKDNMCKIKDLQLTKRFTREETEELRKQYNEKITVGDMYKPEYYLEKYPTFGHYVDYCGSYSTYSILTGDGQWIEPGKMGSFGLSSASPEQERSFHQVFRECINKQRPEDYFILVDCHV